VFTGQMRRLAAASEGSLRWLKSIEYRHPYVLVSADILGAQRI
jgi:hypothetical protein